MTATQYHWLATTAPETGVRVGVMYLGCVRVTEPGGREYYVAGRWCVVSSGCRHDWFEPFRNDFRTEAQAVAAYRLMTQEWDHAVPYRS